VDAPLLARPKTHLCKLAASPASCLAPNAFRGGPELPADPNDGIDIKGLVCHPDGPVFVLGQSKNSNLLGTGGAGKGAFVVRID